MTESKLQKSPVFQRPASALGIMVSTTEYRVELGQQALLVQAGQMIENSVQSSRCVLLSVTDSML
jgi:hypothetical protein